MRTLLPTALVVVILLVCLPAAGAGTIYTTFGPGETFDAGSQLVGGPVNPVNPGLEIHTAAMFTPTDTVTLDSIRIAARYLDGANSVVIRLLGDAGGVPDDGSELESWSLTGLILTGSVHPLTSLVNPTLAAGTPYWIALSPGAVDSGNGWNYSPLGLLGRARKASDAGLIWTPQPAQLTPAFSVQATGQAVPLPAAVWGGIGLLGLMMAARRYRNRPIL